MESNKSVFDVLNAINVNGHTEKKNGLTYLSWAWAWAEIKKNYPNASYTIYENKDGLLYHTDGRTAWVKTGVTIEGLELIEYLPVMDHRNASIPVERITSFDVNKAIQRSLTKACARHGLGLYIYAGEDLPEGETPVERITSFDVNKAIQRSLTKACARHGLGLYIYAGEDLPEGETPAEAPKRTGRSKAEPAPAPAPADGADDLYLVKQLIREAKTKDDLVKIWNDWPEAHEQIKSDFSARRKQLGF